jgi:hypothetical protein
MNDNAITFYPVRNGDTTLIELPDEATILIDCRLPGEDNRIYDVHGDLLARLGRDEAGRPHVSVFILTHPDQDHCCGFMDVFHVGPPDDYTAADKQKGKIIIDELWFAPRIFNEYDDDLCDDALEFREEAQRRIDLYLSGDTGKSQAGNRLRVIGSSNNPDLNGLEDILTIPGSFLNLINGKIYMDFRFFVYAPIKHYSDDKNNARNDTSIVLQARFDVDGEEDAARVFLGGDTACAKWERIIDKNDDENLAWDLFMAPHHCSWGFFSEEAYDKDNPNPNEKIMDLLDLRRCDGYVVVSSKPIQDNNDNPPHYGAAQIYKSVVGKDFFLCTSEHPNEDNPEPIYFTMTANGPVKDSLPSVDKSAAVAAVRQAVSTPRTYG